MASAGKNEYHVFATWPVSSPQFWVGTTTELRGGNWYDGVLMEPPQMQAAFGDGGVQRAADIQFRIADPANGAYRSYAASTLLDGMELDAVAVMRQTLPDGTVTEIISSQRLVIIGKSLQPGEVILKCVDLEETKMGALYPPLQWSATDWPELRDTDAGRFVPVPIGTALKLSCPKLAADDTLLQYFFGVCTATPQLIVISSINSATKTITISGGTTTNRVQAGQAIYITGSSAADGRYTVASVTTSTIVVNETLPASTGGNVRIMPHVLTVYRNGRIVDPAEYQVIHVAARGPITNGDFETGTFSGWSASIVGSGTASASTHRAVLTATNSLNTASVTSSTAVGTSKDLWHVVSADCVAGSTAAADFMGTNTDATRTVPIGTRRALFFRETATGSGTLKFTVDNNSGTTIVDNVVLYGGMDFVALLFTVPQDDFQGNPYTFEADVRGIDSRNAADEVSRLLGWGGMSVDGTSFAAAASVATTNVMLVDCDYGRSGQRTLKAIIEDHLFLLRASIGRNNGGSYTIWQDVAGSSVATYDESAGDSIEVQNADWTGRPTSVSLRYRPSPRDPNTLQNTIKRAVTGGVLGDQAPRDMPYLRDHIAADRLLSYLAKRAEKNGTARVDIYRAQFNVSQVITLSSPINWPNARDFIIRTVRRAPNVNTLDLLEYDSTVYTYTGSTTLPGDPINASGDYQPDYSQTPPAAPTALTITATAVALDRDGSGTAMVTVRSTPPAVNWAQIWFAAIHNVTGELTMVQGSSVGGGNYGATLTGLRTGNVYQLKSYAVNSFGLQGALQATFNATAIGGGATDTTFTTPGYATLPPNISSCTAQQGTGLIIQVSWPAVVLGQDVLGDYILEKKIGVGAFAEVWRGRANGYTDRAFTSYGLSIQYRVKASDRWGNISAAYATSSTVTLQRNIVGGTGSGADITDGSVGTVNRTGVTTVTQTIGWTGPSGSSVFAHGMGVVPIASIVGIGVGGIAMAISALDATNITINSIAIPSATESALGPGAHTHAIGNSLTGHSVSVSVDLW